MKKYAIALLVVPLFLVGVLILGPEKADHESSPAFYVALSNAINRLEGTAIKATIAATPCAQAEAFDLTTDPITCEAADPNCDGLTTDSRPCATLDDQENTCDQSEQTCDQAMTCSGRFTCDDRATCNGTPTCDGSYTCWNSTCEEAEMTCDGSMTCDGAAGCDFTVDGTHTCNGVPTCENTCVGWPGETCEPEFTTEPAMETCDGSETCQNTCANATFPTCQANPDCGITYDGTSTCNGNMTCESTCSDAWPTCGNEKTCMNYGTETCDPYSSHCWHGTERTSWGTLKKKFK